MEYLVGFGLALAAALFARFTGLERDRAFYPTVMIVIALTYGLFAVMGGSMSALALDSGAIVGFIWPIMLGEHAAHDIAPLLAELGHPPNCYVNDQLYVDRHTEYSRRYAEFQHLPVEEVGDLVAWLVEAPTKLVAVADPEEIPAIRAAVAEQFADRMYLTTSLPHLLEMGNPAASKGSGIAFVAERLGISLDRIVAFGDGENDLELIDEAGFGIAVEDANPLLLERADWVCRSAEVEGVATVIDAYLESIA